MYVYKFDCTCYVYEIWIAELYIKENKSINIKRKKKYIESRSVTTIYMHFK